MDHLGQFILVALVAAFVAKAVFAVIAVMAWRTHEAIVPGALSQDDVVELVYLGHVIRESLKCDANGIGLPCRTDREEAVKAMLRYCEICGAIETDGEEA